MKPLKKLRAVIMAMLLIVQALSMATTGASPAHAAESDSPQLLSGNALGQLFPTSTPAIPTGARYTWQQEGVYSTDAGLIAGDPKDATLMADGSVSAISSSANKAGAAYGTLVYDLKAVYRISSVQIWAEYAAASGLKQIEIYASIDGVSYNRVALTESAYGDDAGIAVVTSPIKPASHARYVKIILHKNPDKLHLGIAEAAIWGQTAEAPALLSNNHLKAGGYYPSGTSAVDTKASYKWETEQPFVSQAGLIATDNESGAKNDGSSGGLPDLIDGSSTEETADTTASMAAGSQGRYGTVTFTLGDVYQIGQIDVWSKAEGSHFMDGYEVLLSVDNVNYFSSGYTANPNSRYTNAMVNTPSYGVPGKHAKYVRIVMHNASDSDRLIAGEIAIWGWKLYDSSLPKKATPDKIEFTAELKNYSTLNLDWSSYNSVVNQVNKYGVYVETAPFASTAGLTPKFTAEARSVEQVGKYVSYFALKPETTYYVAVTPFHSIGGERKDVDTLKLTTPSVLGGEKVGDIFAINDAPYGGGNYVHHGEQEDVFLMTKLRLLRDLGGINKNRWWDHSGAMKTLYGKSGLNFHYFYHGPGYVQADNEGGSYTFSTYNEPDLAGRKPADVANVLKANHASLKAASSQSLLVEPALAGVDRLVPGKGLNWLDEFYKSDGQNGELVKTYFDVMDIHPYVKYEYPAVPGLTQGAPEKLLETLQDLKDTMASYGDGDKPIVITELGWSTYTGGSYLKAVDRATQRNYLARAYMHAIASGIRTMHWYDFADDGTETNNLEHNLGLIDWHGKPKESYYGFYTLIRVLKDSQYLGTVANVANPHYGYRFWDENKNRYITSLWDATGGTAKTAKIATTDPGVEVVGIDGSYKYITAVSGMVSVPLSGAPVFIYSQGRVQVNSIQ